VIVSTSLGDPPHALSEWRPMPACRGAVDDASDQRDDSLGLLPLEEYLCRLAGRRRVSPVLPPPPSRARSSAISSFETGATGVGDVPWSSGACCRLVQLQFDVAEKRLQSRRHACLFSRLCRFGYRQQIDGNLATLENRDPLLLSWPCARRIPPVSRRAGPAKQPLCVRGYRGLERKFAVTRKYVCRETEPRSRSEHEVNWRRSALSEAVDSFGLGSPTMTSWPALRRTTLPGNRRNIVGPGKEIRISPARGRVHGTRPPILRAKCPPAAARDL